MFSLNNYKFKVCEVKRKMTILFKAKTQNAYTIKILAELLQNSIKTACFEIDNSGIKLCMMDHHRSILIHLFLESENFSVYKFVPKEKMFLGINLNHFHKMLKSIKKKDSVCLFIDDESPTDLGIKVIPKENTRITTSFVKIQCIQTLDIDLPEGYSKPIIVPSSEYHKMCKDMAHIGTTTSIVSKNFHIKFICNAGSIMKRHVEFGENEGSDDEDDKQEYSSDLDTEQLSRITKISGLSSSIHIYTKEGLPILFKTDIGGLGKISIYMKTKDLIENDNRSIEE
jgi:proliferating cell nuclear antigen PCNA